MYSLKWRAYRRLMFYKSNLRLASLASMWVSQHSKEKAEKESTRNGKRNSQIHGRYVPKICMTPFGVEFVMCVKVLAYCAVRGGWQFSTGDFLGRFNFGGEWNDDTDTLTSWYSDIIKAPVDILISPYTTSPLRVTIKIQFAPISDIFRQSNRPTSIVGWLGSMCMLDDNLILTWVHHHVTLEKVVFAESPRTEGTPVRNRQLGLRDLDSLVFKKTECYKSRFQLISSTLYWISWHIKLLLTCL